MTQVAPKLRQELEVIEGMDDIPMIFDPSTGSYHRISRSGRFVLTHLDGTRTTDDLVDMFAPGTAPQVELREQLESFLAGLHRSGLLVGSDLPRTGEREGRFRTSRLMPRVVLTRSLPTLLEPLVRPLRDAPLRLLGGCALLVAVLGFVLGAHTLFTAARPDLHRVGGAFLLAVVVQLLLVLLHETAHAVVAQVLRVPVRGLGVAMLFYFMPVAYVDRTDAYRLRGRGGRVALALAGMTSDGWVSGVTAVVALNSEGLVHQTAVTVLGFQMIGLVINLNPLLPTDGYTAIETVLGLVDLRGRSYTLLTCLVRRRPLPSHVRSLSPVARRSHLVYAVVSVVYVCCAALLVLTGIVGSVQGAGR